MPNSKPPFLSCIVTAYAEGPLAAMAIESLLAQSFTDFELLIVDDGATAETRSVLHSFDDPRIRHIRQANDGLSSARNRALSAARGEYITFLDADDARPTWAFAEMTRVAMETGADSVFLPGLLCELRNEVSPFYDQDIFAKLTELGLDRGSGNMPRFPEALRLLAALEPQAANKMVRRSFLERHKLRFPSGLFFEDMVFHNALILSLGSYAVAKLPCFTYFRRYARPQITATTGMMRFDAISSAANTLALFERSAHFQDSVLRMVVVGATFKLLKWCEESTSHHFRWQYRQTLLAMVARLDPRFALPPRGRHNIEAADVAPWIGPALAFFEQLLSENARRQSA